MAERNWLIVAVAALAVVLSTPALAVEGGTSFYLLGSKTTMGGYLPPPGVYGVLQNYGYTGKADIDFQRAGVGLSGGIRADAYIVLPTALWVMDRDVFANVRYFYEFGVKYRLQGHAGFLNAVIPLGGH